MKTTKTVLIALVLSLLCISTATAVSTQVSGNSNADQDQINAAIQKATSGDVIKLSGNYYITAPIYLKSGISLEGTGFDTVITTDPKLWAYKGAGMIVLDGVSNANLGGFTINGGEESLSTQHPNSGHSWQNAIIVTGGTSNCVIHDVYFTLLDGDGIFANQSSSGITVKNCVANCVGHDMVQAWGGKNWLVDNCTVNLFINSGVRYANTVDSTIKNSEFYCNTGSGFVGIELEDNVEGTVITNNYFHDLNNKYGTGIATVHAIGSVSIYSNKVSNCRLRSTDGIDVSESKTTESTGARITSSTKATVAVSNNESSKDIEDSECDNCNSSATWYVSNTQTVRVPANYSISSFLVTGYTTQSMKNMALAQELLNSSIYDIEKAMLYANTTEGAEFSAQLLEESTLKEEFAIKLFELSVRDLNRARDVTNATLKTLNGTINENVIKINNSVSEFEENITDEVIFENATINSNLTINNETQENITEFQDENLNCTENSCNLTNVTEACGNQC